VACFDADCKTGSLCAFLYHELAVKGGQLLLHIKVQLPLNGYINLWAHIFQLNSYLIFSINGKQYSYLNIKSLAVILKYNHKYRVQLPVNSY